MAMWVYMSYHVFIMHRRDRRRPPGGSYEAPALTLHIRPFKTKCRGEPFVCLPTRTYTPFNPYVIAGGAGGFLWAPPPGGKKPICSSTGPRSTTRLTSYIYWRSRPCAHRPSIHPSPSSTASSTSLPPGRPRCLSFFSSMLLQCTRHTFSLFFSFSFSFFFFFFFFFFSSSSSHLSRRRRGCFLSIR